MCFTAAPTRSYYDAVFFAGMMKAAADDLGTDGDCAPMVILANEWGHAVQSQLDSASFIGLFRENMAGCLAGAITPQAGLDRYLDRGDLEEAR
jgi:predicted metalloprotease